MLDSVLEEAIRTASVEVQGGAYTPFQLSEIVDRTKIVNTAQSLLALTYDYSRKMLPSIIDENLAQLLVEKSGKKLGKVKCDRVFRCLGE